jgi:hypothetical protein
MREWDETVDGAAEPVRARTSLRDRPATFEVEAERGVFVTPALRIEVRGVEDWLREAEAKGRPIPGRPVPPFAHRTHVESVLAEARGNAERLAAEADVQLNDRRSAAVAAVAATVEAHALAEEAEHERDKRKAELDAISPAVGRLSPPVQALVLVFSFVLELWLLYMAGEQLALPEWGRYLLAGLLAAILTGAIHVVTSWLTTQALRDGGSVNRKAIIIGAGIVGLLVAILLVALAVVRGIEFETLSDNPAFELALVIALGASSFLGSACAAIAGVAHGLEGPRREVERVYRDASEVAARLAKQERDGRSAEQTTISRLENAHDIYEGALGEVRTVAERVANACLDGAGLGQSLARHYPRQLGAFEAALKVHEDELRKELDDALSALDERRREMEVLFGNDGASSRQNEAGHSAAGETPR